MSVILFSHFAHALDFLKKVKIGKIQPQQGVNGFVWDSEQATLAHEQLELIADASGQRYVWSDAQSGLTWLIKDGLSHAANANDNRYGGFSDWRLPSLRELKTLSSCEPDEFGVYVTGALKGRLKGNYRSCSAYRHWSDTAWWDFSNNSATTEDYRDGKVNWGSEGEYAGVESGRSLNSAKLILVRGSDTLHREDWVLKLIEWSECEQLFDFPVIQHDIEEITELSFVLAKSLPADISRLKNLTRITCSVNPDILDNLFKNSRLTDLKLSATHGGSKLVMLPESINKLCNLVHLSAIQIGLKSVHPAIGDLEHLEHLDLRWNQIESIPESIGNLRVIEHLNLAGNLIETIPESLCSLSSLKILNLGGKSMRIIPESLGNLVNLEQLHLEGCYSEFPNSLGALRSLVHLRCLAPLTQLPESFINLRKLLTVCLVGAYIDFEQWPWFEMHWLKGLALSECHIQSIPGEISSMKGLENLDLSGTKITELPQSLLALENLQTLDVSGTLLTSLPEWLADMKSIRVVRAKGVKSTPELRKKIFVRYW